MYHNKRYSINYGISQKPSTSSAQTCIFIIVILSKNTLINYRIYYRAKNERGVLRAAEERKERKTGEQPQPPPLREQNDKVMNILCDMGKTGTGNVGRNVVREISTLYSKKK